MLNFIDILDSIDTTKWFRVVFVKRTDGSTRSMTCRTGVKSGVKGKGLSFSPKDKNLLLVWIPEQERNPDGKDRGHRFIPVDNVLEVHAEGRTWK